MPLSELNIMRAILLSSVAATTLFSTPAHTQTNSPIEPSQQICDADCQAKQSQFETWSDQYNKSVQADGLQIQPLAIQPAGAPTSEGMFQKVTPPPSLGLNTRSLKLKSQIKRLKVLN